MVTGPKLYSPKANFLYVTTILSVSVLKENCLTQSKRRETKFLPSSKGQKIKQPNNISIILIVNWNQILMFLKEYWYLNNQKIRNIHWYKSCHRSFTKHLGARLFGSAYEICLATSNLEIKIKRGVSNVLPSRFKVVNNLEAVTV